MFHCTIARYALRSTMPTVSAPRSRSRPTDRLCFERTQRARVRISGREQCAARRLHRRHVRYQRPRALFPEAVHRQARTAHGDRRSVDFRRTSTANVHPREVARHHPKGESAVFTGDRGSSVSNMAIAFERFLLGRRDLGGIVSAGGSGGTALATQAMRALPVGMPKLMVSSVASADVRPYVGPSDICMMYSVTDVSGINRISERVLVECRARAGRNDRVRAHRGIREQTGDRADDVRRDDAVRAGGDQAAAERIRLPGVSRDRHRRPIDGEAGRLGPARRRARHLDDRSMRRDRRRRTQRRTRAIRCLRAAPDSVRRLMRRARHGELLGVRHGPAEVQGPQSGQAQRQCHVDAHHC